MIEEQKIYTAEVHVLETETSHPNVRRFNCWVEGDATNLINVMSVATNLPYRNITNLQEDLNPSDAIRYIVCIERLAWRWNLSSKASGAGEIKLVRVQQLRY